MNGADALFEQGKELFSAQQFEDAFRVLLEVAEQEHPDSQ